MMFHMLEQTQSFTSIYNRGALKVKEAAEYLGVSPVTIKRLIKRGFIRPNLALRHILIPVAELDRFLQSGRAQ